MSNFANIDQLGNSFANLVATNNGLFKSEKQAAFLLSQLESDGAFMCGGSTWGNSYSINYFCDEKGVTKVVKYTKATGDKVTWTRKVAGEISVQDAKRIKSLTRQLKERQKRLASREIGYAAGEYAGMEGLYEESKAIDLEYIANLEATLASI